MPIDSIDKLNLPQHIAIIMDGNGRWAKKQGEQRTFGHQNGVESVREAIKGCRELGVKHLTLYAFSSENWNRPQEEIDFLMNLLVQAIHNETDELNKNDIKLETIGDIVALPKVSYETLLDAKEKTKNNQSLTVHLALNYGSKMELVRAFKQMANEVKNDALDIEKIDEALISSYLYTKNIPDPEILIRTSNEMRISNFLLWQIAYSELYFLPIFWPDFTKKHLFECVSDFQNRERRFGKTSEQLI